MRRDKDWELLPILPVEFTKAIGSMIRDKDMALKSLATEILMKESTSLEKSMVKESIFGQVESSTKGNGVKDLKMVVEFGKE
jgi:hypothetical protein